MTPRNARGGAVVTRWPCVVEGIADARQARADLRAVLDAFDATLVAGLEDWDGEVDALHIARTFYAKRDWPEVTSALEEFTYHRMRLRLRLARAWVESGMTVTELGTTLRISRQHAQRLVRESREGPGGRCCGCIEEQCHGQRVTLKPKEKR